MRPDARAVPGYEFPGFPIRHLTDAEEKTEKEKKK